jgi:ketosteroid isomerase-like protein
MTATTQTANRTADLLALMKRGDDAFNSQDFEGMNAVHHPDMIVHMPGNGQPIHGREAHAQAMEGMFHIFPDVHVVNDPYPIQFGSDDWITVITRCTGTFRGEMPGPNGAVIAPTGEAFDLDFATTARWEGNLLIEEYVSWDSALQAQQIGLAWSTSSGDGDTPGSRSSAPSQTEAAWAAEYRVPWCKMPPNVPASLPRSRFCSTVGSRWPDCSETASANEPSASPVRRLALRRDGVDTRTSRPDSATSPPVLRLFGPSLRSRSRAVDAWVALLDAIGLGERFGASSFAFPATGLAHALRVRPRCHIPPT